MSQNFLSVQQSTNESTKKHADFQLEGIVQAGGWQPDPGVVVVTEGTSANALPDSGDTPFTPTVQIPAPAYGYQYGPRGGERITFWRTQSGYVGGYQNMYDASLQVVSGEVKQVHYDAPLPPDGDGQITGWWWLKNDGVAQGDNLGGADFGGPADFVSVTAGAGTAGSITVSACASQGLVCVAGPNGVNLVIDVNAGNVSLGSDSIAHTDSVVRKSDLQAALDDIYKKISDWAAASLLGGQGAPPPDSFKDAIASTHVFAEG